jgi:microcystin-dependent protein
MPPPIQLVSLVANGGTPVQLVDQTGAPFPTTGTGALVFANGATLLNPILDNATLINTNITFDRIDLGAGTLDNPAITMGAPHTGFFSAAPHNVSVAIDNAGTPMLAASFDPNGLTVAGYIYGAVPPPGDDSAKSATTSWVNDAIAAIPSINLTAGTGITLTPNPITLAGSIAVNVTALGGPWLPLAGGTVNNFLNVNGTLNALAGFLYFGAVDNAHPMLRRSGTTLEVVLADQTAYAPMHAYNFTSETGLYYLGPATALYPAFRRQGTAVEAVLGDLSDYANFDAKAITATSTISATGAIASQTGYIYSGAGIYYFGSGDTAHPLIRRSGTTVEIMLGDQSNYAPLTASLLNATSGLYYFGAPDAAHPLLRVHAGGDGIEVVNGNQSAYLKFFASDIRAYGAIKADGNVNAVNYGIADGLPTNAGSVGFVTGNGPFITFWGNSSAGAGSVEFTVGGASRGTINSGTGELNWNAAINVPTPAASENSTKVATTAWVKTAIASGASISVGTTPPASPNPNQLWWNSTDGTGGGTLYIWYVDGTSSQWVPAAAPTTSGAQPGDIKASASANAQPGWLKCAGTAVSRTTYATLFAAIGTTYGAGDGSTTFNLPDYRGRSLFGVDDGSGRLGSGRPGGITGAAVLGATGGEQSHVTLNTETAPAGAAGGGISGFFTSNAYGPAVWLIQSGGNGYNASFEYGGLAHNTVPPAAVVYWYIKT